MSVYLLVVCFSSFLGVFLNVCFVCLFKIGSSLLDMKVGELYLSFHIPLLLPSMSPGRN